MPCDLCRKVDFKRKPPPQPSPSGSRMGCKCPAALPPLVKVYRGGRPLLYPHPCGCGLVTTPIYLDRRRRDSTGSGGNAECGNKWVRKQGRAGEVRLIASGSLQGMSKKRGWQCQAHCERDCEGCQGDHRLPSCSPKSGECATFADRLTLRFGKSISGHATIVAALGDGQRLRPARC